MKKNIYIVICSMVLSFGRLLTINQQPVFQSEFNRLELTEVSESQDATQVTFSFAQPIYFKKALNKDNLQLCLYFPGMRLQHFDKKNVLEKLDKLKQIGLVNKVDLFEENKNFPQVVLMIDFAKTRQVNRQINNKPIKNSLLIKWCKLEDPNKLIFDIYTKETLDNLNVKDSIVLKADNSVEKPRIVIDAGHGGDSKGAQCYGLSEKDLTLDIAMRSRLLLKNSGASVFLTRNSDMDISLGDRTELANQLKANLFVSIHVNSGGAAGEGPCGLETYYLNTKELLPPARRGGFLFVNLEKNLGYAAAIDKQLQEKANLSRKLACTIQDHVMSVLRTQNSSIVNRGVKSERFRIFFNSPNPTALVEVGFITNKKEARLLAGAKYRQLIAQGICEGITEYISANKKSF